MKGGEGRVKKLKQKMVGWPSKAKKDVDGRQCHYSRRHIIKDKRNTTLYSTSLLYKAAHSSVCQRIKNAAQSSRLPLEAAQNVPLNWRPELGRGSRIILLQENDFVVSRRLHEERTKKDRQCSGAPRSHQEDRSRRMSCCCCCGGLKWLKCLPVNDAVPRVLGTFCSRI